MSKRDKYTTIAILAFSFSLICWLITIGTTYITKLDIESGLSIHLQLPWCFYASIVLLGIGFIALSRKPNSFLLIFGIAISVCILFGTYAFVEPNARMGSSYYPAGMVNQILSDNNQSATASSASNPYEYFKGFQYFTAAIVTLTGIDTTAVIKYFHLPLIFIICLLYMSIARKLVGDKYVVILVVPIFIAGTFSEQFYFGPQLLAYTLLMLWLFIFLKQDEISTPVFYTSIMLTFAAILFTHMLTPLPIIIFCIIYYVLSRFKFFSTGRITISLSIVLLFTVAYIVFLVYLAQVFFEGATSSLLSTIFNPEKFFFMLSSGRQELPGIATPVKQVNYYSHVIYYLLLFVVPILIMFYHWSASIISKKRIDASLLILSVWIISQLSMFVLIYAGEIINRIFLFTLPATVILAVTAIKSKRLMWGILLVILLLLHPLAYAGDECYKLTPDSELAGAKFFATNTESEMYFVQVGHQYIWYYEPSRAWEYFYTLKLPPLYAFNPDVNIYYLIRDTQGKNGFLFHLGYDLLDEQNAFIDSQFNYIYSNGDYQVYKRIS